MKKTLILSIAAVLVFLSACTGRHTLEENDVNAPVTVEDSRTASTPSSSAANSTLTQGVTSPLTGRKVLSPAVFEVNDPQNTRGLSVERIEHSYGVAKNGEPHEISKNAQKYFESTNYNVICYDTMGIRRNQIAQ